MAESDRTPAFNSGDRLGRFEIRSEVGRGGMGVVFHAVDVELGNDVALKIPWPRLLEDADAKRRLRRVARLTSKLDHPAIVSLIGLFEQDDTLFLVMPLIRGENLAETLAREGPLPIETAVGFGEQLAGALEHAHEKGVLHRDVNPRNVLVTQDRRVLLTDFGLARFLGPEADPSTSTDSLITGPQSLVGTLPYMSPEQVFGRELDGRSDIFALGTVLYEMCTGVRAFSGSASGEILDQIAHREPAPISRFNYEVPDEMERIIRKCLVKQVEDRFQSVRELRVDLSVLSRNLQPALSAPPERTESPGLWVRALPWAIAGVLAIALTLVLTNRQHASWTIEAPHPVTISPAWEGEPAISPDGTRIAYVSNEFGTFDLTVISTQGGYPLRLTGGDANISGPAWFPDGTSLAFTSDRSGTPSVWKIGQVGGRPTLLVEDARSPSVSPDGTQLAFLRSGAQGYERVWICSLDDPTDARAVTGDELGLWNHRHPVWSPDGRRVAFASREDLWWVPAAGGAAQRLTRDQEYDGPCAWSADGKTVFFASRREGTTALWWQRCDEGSDPPERLTMGTGWETHPSVSPQTGQLAYATQLENHDIALLDRSTGEVTRVSTTTDDWMPSLAPDGSAFVFTSSRGTTDRSLWIQDLSGGVPQGDARQITSQRGIASHPRVSPDGRWIAYYRVVDGSRDIWIAPTGGGTPRAVTVDPASDLHPAWSPDGGRLVYVSERTGQSQLWSVALEHGETVGPPALIGTPGLSALAPAWSPDGREIAFIGCDSLGTCDVWIIAPGDLGDTPVATPSRVTVGADARRVGWDASTHELLVSVSEGRDRISLRRIDRAGRDLGAVDAVDFGAQPIYVDFDLTSNGEVLVYSHRQLQGDIWVAQLRGP